MPPLHFEQAMTEITICKNQVASDHLREDLFAHPNIKSIKIKEKKNSTKVVAEINRHDKRPSQSAHTTLWEIMQLSKPCPSIFDKEEWIFDINQWQQENRPYTIRHIANNMHHYPNLKTLTIIGKITSDQAMQYATLLFEKLKGHSSIQALQMGDIVISHIRIATRQNEVTDYTLQFSDGLANIHDILNRNYEQTISATATPRSSL
ncbi:MAG: hypothetical protein KAS93_03175 [Gammaproteobacteria bacterium]|nr:hypothetical protein [Gammaproteobacteria bacterium]